MKNIYLRILKTIKFCISKKGLNFRRFFTRLDAINSKQDLAFLND